MKSDWEEIVEEIIKIEAKKENVLLIGDVNRHLGNKLIKNNHEEVTAAGKMLLEFLDSNDYILINATDKSSEEPFTRYNNRDPDNKDEKSVLDLAIVSGNLFKYVEKLEVNKELKWTPSQTSKGSLKYTDNYALKIVFKGLPKVKDIVTINKKESCGIHEKSLDQAWLNGCSSHNYP